MQKLVALTVLICVSAIGAQKCEDPDAEQCVAENSMKTAFDQEKNWNKATTIYDFYARDIHGNNVSLDKYRGHACIIVNVASNCMLTDGNYNELNQLYGKYSEKEGLRILAFPCNQFGGQEPGSSEQILDFVQQHNVTFDVFEKINVNGESAHPLWKWMKTQEGGFITNDIKWNFTKFLINKEGKVVARYAPTTSPLQFEAELKKLF